MRKYRRTSDFAAFYKLKKSSSYLNKTGWFDSYHKAIPVDKENRAIPWYTYSAIDFLKGRVNESMAIYEFGSGNSTIWWANHVNKVISCEHDKQWFARLKNKVPDNVEYRHVELSTNGDYSKSITKYKSEFDVVVIDGRDRVNCAINSIAALKSTGVIVWDNSDREKYEAGYKFLIDNGFRRLDFTGVGPINCYGWSTSLFYRSGNCFEV